MPSRTLEIQLNYIHAIQYTSWIHVTFDWQTNSFITVHTTIVRVLWKSLQ